MCHQPHVEHKKQQHFAYTNYAIISNTSNINKLSQNMGKAFSTPHKHPLKGDFDTPLVATQIVDTYFQMALAAVVHR